MNDLSAERTPLVIAAEINMITHQTKKIMLTSAIEIGRRLKEAKDLVKHGEWIKWLEESVSYSRRTAERLIKLYEEYGADFLDGSDGSNATLVSHLTYTQALLLLGLPEEEREEFIAQNDVVGMTKEEILQAIKDRDRARQEKDQALQAKDLALQEKNQALQEKNQALQEYIVLKKGLEAIDGKISELKKERTQVPPHPDHPEKGQVEASAPDAASPASNSPSASNNTLLSHNLPTKLDPNAAAKHVERCDSCCKTIANTFFDLTTALTNLNYLDLSLKEKKRKEAQKLLDTIAETIKEWPPAKKPLIVIN